MESLKNGRKVEKMKQKRRIYKSWKKLQISFGFNKITAFVKHLSVLIENNLQFQICFAKLSTPESRNWI